jgi:hypothetical protein
MSLSISYAPRQTPDVNYDENRKTDRTLTQEEPVILSNTAGEFFTPL